MVSNNDRSEFEDSKSEFDFSGTYKTRRAGNVNSSSSNNLWVPSGSSSHRSTSTLIDRRRESLSFLRTSRSLEPTYEEGQSNLLNDTNKTGQDNTISTPIKPPTIKSAWFKWTMANHTFENVLLTKSDVDGFSAAVKEYMEISTEKDTGKEKYILPSIKYFFRR